ncbi:MAG TPA: hypothetical protein VFM62_04325 [Arthrobacter sp.]|nr:hypothetical protein [Arthrobacter sp.]
MDGMGRSTTVDELQGLGTPLTMVMFHAAIVVFAVRGYRTWRAALASQRSPAPYGGLL